MSKKRTLQDKIEARQARERVGNGITVASPSYSFEYDSSKQSAKPATAALLRIDQRYIAKDLIKTLLISALLFTLLIGIYFYLSYN